MDEVNLKHEALSAANPSGSSDLDFSLNIYDLHKVIFNLLFIYNFITTYK